MRCGRMVTSLVEWRACLAGRVGGGRVPATQHGEQRFEQEGVVESWGRALGDGDTDNASGVDESLDRVG